MLRATLACALLSLGLADSAAASANGCRCSVASGASGCETIEASLPSSVPVVPDGGPIAWCERPDDPHCTPASPAPSPSLGAVDGSHAALTLATDLPVGGPRCAEAPSSLARRLGPSAGVRARIERPPMR
jgi:hypothetical protein